MAAKRKTTTEDTERELAQAFSKKAEIRFTQFWLVGETPLITHAWSQKAKMEMLAKQVKGIKPAKEARNPEEEFLSSLYEIGEDPKTGKMTYGFPAMGLKNAILSVAHKDKGIPRTAVMQSLWIIAPIVRTRPALTDAICDMPLLRIYGDEPEQREDMVKIGAGLNKTASFAYRAQFFTWAMRLRMKYNASVLSELQLLSLIEESGFATGIGEWRNEKRGIFGAYRIGDIEEQAAWTKFAKGEGPLPQRTAAEDESMFDLLEAA